MNLSDMLVHPATIYFLLGSVLGMTCLVLRRMRLESQAQERRLSARQTSVEELTEALRQAVAQLSQDVDELAGAAPPITGQPREGLNRSRRSQALGMYRSGESPEQIAAAIKVPLQEVRLLLKVQGIVVGGW